MKHSSARPSGKKYADQGLAQLDMVGIYLQLLSYTESPIASWTFRNLLTFYRPNQSIKKRADGLNR